MKKCVNCKKYNPISYIGGCTVFNYCNQGEWHYPCDGKECQFPEYYESKDKK